MITQRVASDAEESACASEDLYTQSEELNRYVSQLAALVGERTALDADRPPKAHGKSPQGKQSFRDGDADPDSV